MIQHTDTPVLSDLTQAAFLKIAAPLDEGKSLYHMLQEALLQAYLVGRGEMPINPEEIRS